MKKVLKYVLSILLVVIVGTAGTAYYFFNVKTYEVKDEKVAEIIETVYEIILPGEMGDEVTVGETIGAATSGDTEENSSEGSQLVGSNETASGISTTESKSVGNSSEVKPIASSGEKNSSTVSGGEKPVKEPNPAATVVTAESIKSKYVPVFQSLESQANARINALVGAAIGEYRAKQANGEQISFSYFYQKYSSAGHSLESKTDAAFDYIYSALVNDLKKHGYDASHAADVKAQYAASKRSREAALLSQAKGGL